MRIKGLERDCSNQYMVCFPYLSTPTLWKIVFNLVLFKINDAVELMIFLPLVVTTKERGKYKYIHVNNLKRTALNRIYRLLT